MPCGKFTFVRILKVSDRCDECCGKRNATIMKNVARVPRWWEVTRGQFSPLWICLILAVLAILMLGIAIGVFNPLYSFAVAGALATVIVASLRLDQLAVTLIIATHLWIDWYLSLHLVGILMALVLLFAYYLGRSADHPWVRPRPLWLWALFLVLTIYPAISWRPVSALRLGLLLSKRCPGRVFAVLAGQHDCERHFETAACLSTAVHDCCSRRNLTSLFRL